MPAPDTEYVQRSVTTLARLRRPPQHLVPTYPGPFPVYGVCLAVSRVRGLPALRYLLCLCLGFLGLLRLPLALAIDPLGLA